MAFTQQTSGKTIVPWFNRNEWLFVFEQLYSKEDTLENKQKALDVLLIWKTRIPLLPSGVEGTLIIVQVLVSCPDLNSTVSKREIQTLCTMYSSAITRFLNLCAAYDNRQGTFYQKAKQMNIPNWIVDLRHISAHSSDLPDFYTLHKACIFALDWLKNQYWIPVNQNINDCITGSADSVQETEEKIVTIMSLYECIIICQHEKWNLKRISDISDVESRRLMLESLSHVHWVNNYTELTYVQSELEKEMSNFLKVKSVGSNKHSLLIDVLVNGDTFLCEPELAQQLFGDGSIEQLPWSFVKLWKKMIIYIQKKYILRSLILKLFSVSNSSKETNLRRTLASLWLVELAKGFSKHFLCQGILQRIQKENNLGDLSHSELNKLISNECEFLHPKTKNCLTFNCLLTVPSVATNLNVFKQYVLSNPTEYTKIFLPYFLEIIDPPISERTKREICEIVEVYTNSLTVSHSTDLKNSKIYTVDDIERLGYDDNEIEMKKMKLANDIELINNDKSKVVNADKENNNIWEHAPAHIDFSKSPLGLLPWQKTDENPLLMNIFKNKQV